MNSFVMSRDLIRGQIGSHSNEILLIRSFMLVELQKNAGKTNISKTKVKIDQP